MKYRKKPVVIDAFKLESNAVFPAWFIHAIDIYDVDFNEDGTCIIKTLEGNHLASIGDYIIKGVKGEMYPCKPDIFEMTYEEAES